MAENEPNILVPNEIVHLQNFLCGLIKLSDNRDHLNSILVTILRIPQETMEQSQIHQLMIDYDKRFDKIEEKQDKQADDMKWVKRGLAGLGGLIPIVQAVLSVIGIT